MTCSSQRWVFRLARTVWRFGFFVSPSNQTLVSSMSWTQRWVFLPHKRSYCLGSWYALSYWFLVQLMLSRCSLVCILGCQKYAVILLKLRLFEMRKYYFQEIVQLIVVFFAAGFFVCFIVCLSLLWCSCLEESLCTTIFITVKHVFKRNLNCLAELFNFFFHSFLSCTPNLSWVRYHLLWFTHIAEPYFRWGWKICA